MFVFLARAVKKTEMPGVEGGFDGDMEASWKQLQNPSVRLAGLVADSDKKLKAAEEAAAKVRVALVGTLEGLELSQWTSRARPLRSRRTRPHMSVRTCANGNAHGSARALRRGAGRPGGCRRGR